MVLDALAVPVGRAVLVSALTTLLVRAGGLDPVAVLLVRRPLGAGRSSCRSVPARRRRLGCSRWRVVRRGRRECLLSGCDGAELCTAAPGGSGRGEPERGSERRKAAMGAGPMPGLHGCLLGYAGKGGWPVSRTAALFVEAGPGSGGTPTARQASGCGREAIRALALPRGRHRRTLGTGALRMGKW